MPGVEALISGRTPAFFIVSRKNWMSLNELAKTWS